MRLNPCGCGLGYLVRLNRTFWMRFVPGRRHYYCVRCKSHELLSREDLRRLFPSLPSVLDRDDTAPAPLEEPGLWEQPASARGGTRAARSTPKKTRMRE